MRNPIGRILTQRAQRKVEDAQLARHRRWGRLGVRVTVDDGMQAPWGAWVAMSSPFGTPEFSDAEIQTNVVVIDDRGYERTVPVSVLRWPADIVEATEEFDDREWPTDLVTRWNDDEDDGDGTHD